MFLECLDAMLSTFQEVALCVVIERNESGPLDKVILQVSLELRLHINDT